MSKLFALTLTTFLFFPTFVLSEPEGTVGRLSDGRAYRVDKAGYQITDRLAELEITTDDLQRQVRVLEDEIIEKNKLIEELGGEVKASSPRPIKEQEIVATNSRPQTQRIASRPAAQRKAPTALDCSAQLAPLRSQIGGLESELRAARRKKPVKNQCDYESRTAPLRAQITRLQNALMENASPERLKQREDSNRSKLMTTVSALEQNVDAQKTQLTSLQRDLTAARNEIAQKEQREQKLNTELAEMKSELQRQQQLASRAQQAPKTTLAQVRAKPVVSVPTTIDKDVVGVRRKLKSEVRALRKLISKRKGLADKVRKKRPGVAVQIQALKTKKGVSLDALRLKIKQMSSTGEYGELRSGVTDIAQKLKEDIALLKRLLRRA